MRRIALVGFSGFVGSNIAAQIRATDLFNSTNFSQISGQSFDLVISAANRAEMWRINADPEPDRAEIEQFANTLSTVDIGRLVLISTVAVYGTTTGVDESTELSETATTPYGANRLYLERFCAQHFDTTILRLPGLFGRGLKKNVVYDLLHHNQVDKLHTDARYQYYDLARIGADIDTALTANLSLVNLVPPPVSTGDVARECFGYEFSGRPDGVRPANWDVTSLHAAFFGGTDGYIMSRSEEVRRLRAFVEDQGATR